MNMNKKLACWTLLMVLACKVEGQDPVTLVIKEGIKKVIIAVDLKI
jgi:hypothetical protein